MRKPSISCTTLLATLVAGSVAYAQHLPATPPTSLPAANTLTAPIAAIPVSSAPHRAEVTYAAGLLNVRADNSSLNQILREIARITGTTITGGVADQRVFGNYGPAKPGTILATLLDGTGSNMLLRISTKPNVPSELILTPRDGGPTLPSPTSAAYTEAPPQAPRPPFPPQRNFPPNFPHPGMPGSTQPPLNSGNAAPTNGSNPNGIATPEQIFQKLRALQQSRQNATQQPTTTTPH